MSIQKYNLTELSLRIRSSLGIIPISIPVTTTFHEFETIIRSSINIESNKKFNILAGYPPKPLDLTCDGIVSEVLMDKELLVVQYNDINSKLNHSTSNASKMNRNAELSSKKSPSSSSSSLKSSSISKGKSSQSKSIVSSNVSSSSKPKLTGIVTLQTINTVKRRNRTTKKSLSLGDELVKAVSGGKSTTSGLLRDDFKRAILFRNEESIALSRVNSVYSNNYTIEEIRTINSETLPRLKITFVRGSGYRSTITEVVDCIPIEILKEILNQQINEHQDGVEMLKLHNLARMSPRTFWSLVKYGGSDVITTLKSLIPSITDWKFILDRVRELSSKAKSNLLEKQEKESRKASKRRKISVEVLTIEASDLESKNTSGITARSSGIFDSKKIRFQLNEIVIRNNFDIKLIVPECYLPFILQVIRSVDVQSVSDVFLLANAGYDTDGKFIDGYYESMLGRMMFFQKSSQMNSSTSTPVCNMNQLDSWIVDAQCTLVFNIWSQLICLKGNEVCRRTLAAVGLYNNIPALVRRKNDVSELAATIMKVNPSFFKLYESFYTSLNQQDFRSGESCVVDTVSHEVEWNEKIVGMLISVCEDAVKAFPWISNLEISAIDDDDPSSWYYGELPCEFILSSNTDDSRTQPPMISVNEQTSRLDVIQEYMKQLADYGWKIYLKKNNDISTDSIEDATDEYLKYLGQSVCVWTSEEKDYWIEGTCVAYLPSSEDEPMALWKILIDGDKLCSIQTHSTVDVRNSYYWFEDLEKHEIIEAFERSSQSRDFNVVSISHY